MGCCGSSEWPQFATPDLDLDHKAWAGQWHVYASNLDLWSATQGNRNPRITYGILPGEGPVRMSDLVEYDQPGCCGGPQSVHGVDTALPGSGNTFRWRGRGCAYGVVCLCCCTSDWKVMALDDDMEWAVTVFQPTAFTAEGLDILSREAEMPAEHLEAAWAAIRQDPALAAKAKGVFVVESDDSNGDSKTKGT